MAERRVTKRARLMHQLGRDPGEAIHEMVFRKDRTFREAGARFGVNGSTAWRWMHAWEGEQSTTQPAESVA